jgi:hypothetical protein
VLSAVASHLTLAPSGLHGQLAIDLPRADLPDLAKLRGLLPANGFRVDHGRGRVRFHADVDLSTGSASADGKVVARGIRARVGTSEFTGDLAGIVRARRSERTNGLTDLSGSSVSLSRVRTKSAPEDEWWGAVTLADATLATTGGARFKARAHLTAKDATPATDFVAENTGVPTWAADSFTMPSLAADAKLRLAPGSFEVSSLVARGGGTAVRAEYARRDGRQDGAVLMDLGWISVVYDLTEGATGLVLIGPESWYERKVSSMRSSAAATRRRSDAATELARYAGMTPSLRNDAARDLATRCWLEADECDGRSVGNLLRTAVHADERDELSGILYAPLLASTAKKGAEGSTLDALLIGSLAETLRVGGVSSLDNLPCTTRFVAAADAEAARGRVIHVVGRTSSIRRKGSYSFGALTSEAEPVYFVTPFPAEGVSETLVRFRGVFVQWYTPPSPERIRRSSLVLVGAFGL